MHINNFVLNYWFNDRNFADATEYHKQKAFTNNSNFLYHLKAVKGK